MYGQGGIYYVGQIKSVMSSPRPSKRQRIYRACDQCRRRKSKCDGEQPTCAICRSAGRECSYQTGGGRRGLAPGYVRSLEVIIGLAFQNIPNSEATVNGILFDSRNNNFFRSKTANAALNAWRKSKPSKGLSQLLSNSDDAHDDLDWEQLEDQDQDERMDDQPISQVNEVSAEVHAPLPAPSNPLDAPVPEGTPDLLEFYFTYTHPWFPILERRELLRAMHQGPGTTISGVSSSRILLWAVIVYSSIMRDTAIPRLPTPSIIHLFIQQQALSNWQSLELAHVQAILILALIHIATGDLCLAWNLVGQATRMISTLPSSAKKGRFSHTFNGSVFLDNILSATLGNTPGLSQQEQMACGPIEEDDVDEWDVWTASRTDPSSGRKAPAPLRALSNFNQIHQLMNCLSEILCSPTDSINVDETLTKIQNTFNQSHPYNKQTDAYPPILFVHLTCTFTTITLLCKAEQVSPTIIDLSINNIHHMLDLLEHYQDIIGATRPSPLVYCFALQSQHCIHRITETLSKAQRESLEKRLSKFSQAIPPPILQSSSAPYIQPLIVDSIEQDTLVPIMGMSTSQALTEAPSISMEAQTHPSAMDISSVPPQGDQLPAVPMGIEGYDALFEEMVTSFPSSRQEPVFAHNLGFYDGDLDTDFLAHLQHPPAG